MGQSILVIRKRPSSQNSLSTMSSSPQQAGSVAEGSTPARISVDVPLSAPAPFVGEELRILISQTIANEMEERIENLQKDMASIKERDPLAKENARLKSHSQRLESRILELNAEVGRLKREILSWELSSTTLWEAAQKALQHDLAAVRVLTLQRLEQQAKEEEKQRSGNLVPPPPLVFQQVPSPDYTISQSKDDPAYDPTSPEFNPAEEAQTAKPQKGIEGEKGVDTGNEEEGTQSDAELEELLKERAQQNQVYEKEQRSLRKLKRKSVTGTVVTVEHRPSAGATLGEDSGPSEGSRQTTTLSCSWCNGKKLPRVGWGCGHYVCSRGSCEFRAHTMRNLTITEDKHCRLLVDGKQELDLQECPFCRGDLINYFPKALSSLTALVNQAVDFPWTSELKHTFDFTLDRPLNPKVGKSIKRSKK